MILLFYCIQAPLDVNFSCLVKHFFYYYYYFFKEHDKNMFPSNFEPRTFLSKKRGAKTS